MQMAVGPAGNTNVPPQTYGGVPLKQDQVGEFKEALNRSTTSNDASGTQPTPPDEKELERNPARTALFPGAYVNDTAGTILPDAGRFETFEAFVAAAPAPCSTEFLTEQWQMAHPDTLIVGINPSSMKKNFVDVGENPGHTLVALKDSSGELVKVFSYGPEDHGIEAAFSCKAGGKTGYALHKGDVFNLYQWPITEDQLEQAEGKMKEIENNPGTYDAGHQCTTTSLEIVEAAGIHAPSGKTDVEAYNCGGLLQGIPTPAGLDRDLREKLVPEQVPATYFERLVEVE
jgi:hypothetical protein